MASVVTRIKMSDYHEHFKCSLDRIYGAYHETMALDFDDSHKGL